MPSKLSPAPVTCCAVGDVPRGERRAGEAVAVAEADERGDRERVRAGVGDDLDLVAERRCPRGRPSPCRWRPGRSRTARVPSLIVRPESSCVAGPRRRRASARPASSRPRRRGRRSGRSAAAAARWRRRRRRPRPSSSSDAGIGSRWTWTSSSPNATDERTLQVDVLADLREQVVERLAQAVGEHERADDEADADEDGDGDRDEAPEAGPDAAPGDEDGRGYRESSVIDRMPVSPRTPSMRSSTRSLVGSAISSTIRPSLRNTTRSA